jgi:hypothetical protein
VSVIDACALMSRREVADILRPLLDHPSSLEEWPIQRKKSTQSCTWRGIGIPRVQVGQTDGRAGDAGAQAEVQVVIKGDAAHEGVPPGAIVAGSPKIIWGLPRSAWTNSPRRVERNACGRAASNRGEKSDWARSRSWPRERSRPGGDPSRSRGAGSASYSI